MTTWWGQHDPSDNSQSQLSPKPYSRNPQSPAKFLAHEKFSSAPYYHALKMGKKELEASGALASFPHHAPVRNQIPQEFRGEKVVLRAGGAGWHWRHPSGGRRGRCRGRDGQGTRPRPRREAQLPRRLPAVVAGPSPGDGGEANAWGDRSGGGGHGWRRGFWERALGIAKRGDHTRVRGWAVAVARIFSPTCGPRGRCADTGFGPRGRYSLFLVYKARAGTTQSSKLYLITNSSYIVLFVVMNL
jgi:hypothetical protein